MDPVVIVSGFRTPCGGLLGELSPLKAPQLGAAVIKAILEKTGLDAGDIHEVLMGNVLSAGIGQGPARQASRLAGIPDWVGATTLNKLCGSGLKAIMMAHDMICAGTGKVMIAGGMESMSNAPYILQGARAGLRMGHSQTLDHMFFDGLEDAETGKLMGVFAQEVSDAKGLTREAMDEFAISSLKRAQEAQTKQLFKDEIMPVVVPLRKGEMTVSEDEQPKTAKPEKIPQLRPAFKKDGGTITAANASSISDGAAAVLLMKESEAQGRGLDIQAKIVGHASNARHPSEFTIAPCGAIQKLLNQVGWTEKDVDLFEINEAFAMVAMLPMIEIGIDRDKVNVNGGACALGHPVGATGARLIVTLMNALKQRNLKRGVAALCIGGGEAVAMAIELV
tara:strand:- start:3013 stop:4191 length:1179 start_codon:yes stop_codon:yes gene_type:complete